MTDLLDVALIVAEALDASAIPYTIGGSLASSLSGEPRASIDIDIVVAMTADRVVPFAETLGDDFYVEPDSLRRAIATHSSATVIHRGSGIKVDFFPAGSELETQQLARRRRVQVRSEPDAFLYIHSAEDILLQKLAWYRLGGGVSDRQWRDALSIIVRQQSRLDREYLATMADRAGLRDLLERAYREVPPSA